MLITCHKCDRGRARQIRTVSLALRRSDVRERRLLEHAADLRAQLEPDVAQPFGRAVVLELVRPHASHGGDRPLELADDVGDRDLLRRPRELVAALGAALARDQAAAAELGRGCSRGTSAGCSGPTRAARPSSGRAAPRRAPPSRGARSRPWPRPAWPHSPSCGDASGRRRGAGGAGRRGCRPASSRASCGRAAPGSCAGRRRRRADGSRRRAGGGAGAGRSGAGCSCRAAGRARRGRTRRSLLVRARAAPRAGSGASQAAASSPSGTTRSFPPLPRRTCTSSCSKSTSPRSRPTASALRRPAEYTSSTSARFRSAIGPSPSRDSSIRSTSAAAGASGRRRARRGPSRASGTRSGPSACRRKARTAASLRLIVDGASFLPRRAPPSQDDVVGEDADVDPVEARAAILEPAAELPDVAAVGATGRLAQRRRGEEAIGGRACVHEGRFAGRQAFPLR